MVVVEADLKKVESMDADQWNDGLDWQMMDCCTSDNEPPSPLPHIFGISARGNLIPVCSPP